MLGVILQATRALFSFRMFQALTLDVIAQAAFALKVDSQTNPDDALLTVCRALFKSFFGPMMKALRKFITLANKQPSNDIVSKQHEKRNVYIYIYKE